MNKINLLLFTVLILSISILIYTKLNYNPDFSNLELKFLNYSCSTEKCDISFSIKNNRKEDKNFDYYVTASEINQNNINRKYILTKGQLKIPTGEEKNVKEKLSLLNYSEKKQANLNWDYEIHFYKYVNDKTIKISVELIELNSIKLNIKSNF